jgi:hypothetical protein
MGYLGAQFENRGGLGRGEDASAGNSGQLVGERKVVR